jgi:uncharacterized membrane protein YfcA
MSVLGVADAAFWLKTLVVGVVSGVLSGMFGIGGGMITTPAIRLLLGGSAIVAVATPLPIIIPTAITGAVGYVRRGIADVRAGLIIGGSGAVAAVVGAYATRWIGGSALMIATGVLVVYMAGDMLVAGLRAGSRGPEGHAPEGSVSASEEGPLLVSDEAATAPQAAPASAPAAPAPAAPAPAAPASAAAPAAKLAYLGLAAGLYSGLLGLGGGFVIVPLLIRLFRFGTKRAIGTSLVAIAILSVPGTITHALLGHIDWRLAIALMVGVIPGAWLGARVTATASERHIRAGFAIMLAIVGVIMFANEMWVLLR